MRILIIQLRRIGDVIVTTPVVDALRAAFPRARVEFLVEEAAAPVLSNYPGLDEVLVFDKGRFVRCLKEVRRRKYDWVLDFMNNPRTAQLSLLSGAPVRAGFSVPLWGLVYTVRVPHAPTPKYAVQSKFDLLRALGLQPPPEDVLPRITTASEDFEGVKNWWNSVKLDKYRQKIAVCSTHRREIRRWPAEKFSELINLLLKVKDRALILFGGPGEESCLSDLARPFPERVFQTPSTTLRQAAALLSRCDVTVANDNGLMHLSVALGLPTVTLYGPTWPESWNPRIPPHRWLQAEGLSCVGCNLDICPYKHECMEWVSAERVRRAVEETLLRVPAGKS